MNSYEKSGLIREHIENMEKRLGMYLWIDGSEKADSYAQMLITAIQASNNELISLLDLPVINVGGAK